MLQTVMLGSALGRGRRERYPGFYRLRRPPHYRMNRGEQETLFRQSRQMTRIVPSRDDLVLSVLKSPINQQQQQQQQASQYHHSNYLNSQEHHVNCQDHPNHKRCSHPGSVSFTPSKLFSLICLVSCYTKTFVSLLLLLLHSVIVARRVSCCCQRKCSTTYTRLGPQKYHEIRSNFALLKYFAEFQEIFFCIYFSDLWKKIRWQNSVD